MPRYIRSFSVLLTLAGVFGLIAPLTGCSTNPATGRSQLNMMSEDQEIRLGEEAAPEFIEEAGGPIPDEHINQHIRNIGMRMAAISERPDLPWEFFTLDSAIINAFALPGGKVFITRGLLSRMTNEAQLAGVLGHEIGHVTAKHINDRLTQNMAVQAVIVSVGVAGSVSDSEYLQLLGIGAQTGGTLYLLSFSRGQEHESDDLGLRYMVEVGYDPMGQVQVMEILKEASGGGAGIEWLQTHPLPDSRIRELNDLVNSRYAHTQNNPDYTLGKASFRTNILNRLANLPPAKHTGEEDPAPED